MLKIKISTTNFAVEKEKLIFFDKDACLKLLKSLQQILLHKFSY